MIIPIQKVLVANRGEIALRIFRTLRRMGIQSVAIYAGTDKGHTTGADEVWPMSGQNLSETYLNAEQIIRIAKQSGADAIHPGYGFLSENPDFSAMVRSAGLVFIGPSDAAIRVMGNKSQARKLAEDHNVPVIAGVTGHPSEMEAAALSLGFPLLVKAAAGGGGKGMRIVQSEKQLKETLDAVSREALSYFGNGEIYLERYLENPRHIEIQLLADHHGQTLCLFERECSVQRRYQKIIEEAPAPFISDTLRQNLMQSAKRLAQAISYSNAGTIEFLVSGEAFYFLEMNTRIQVEHPVTEKITGLDIVEQQLLIAMNKPLGINQEDLKIQGHAIEVRVYAEDPYNGFRPSPGKLLHYQEPVMPGLRIDSAMQGQMEISSLYDPMISKMIAHGKDRSEARDILMDALSCYAVHGIRTNISFLYDLLGSGEFLTTPPDTGYCDRFMQQGFSAADLPTEDFQWILPAFLFAATAAFNTIGSDESSPWHQGGFWRPLIMTKLCVDEKERNTGAFVRNGNQVQLIEGGDLHAFSLVSKDANQMVLHFNGRDELIRYSVSPDELIWLQRGSRAHAVRFCLRLDEDEVNARSHNPSLNNGGMVFSPMHGRIVKVDVVPGQEVNKGDTLLILESMKMENKVLASARAVVESIHVNEGEMVAEKSPLVYLSSGI